MISKRQTSFIMGVLGALLLCSSTTADPAPAGTTQPPDSAMVLQGGEELTPFKSLNIEGEDRIRIEFERPPLRFDLDPTQAPGLEWNIVHDVLERSRPDLVSPYLDRSAGDRPVYFARPWLDGLATGGVARFRPAVKGVERWRLTIANSAGETVAGFEGTGKPPKEIVWDGRTSSGSYAAPGHTYSYGFEAHDRAGNKRNIVGDGFTLKSYRITTGDGLVMLFSGADLGASGPTGAVLLEAASWLNQAPRSEEPIRIEVTARTFARSKALAEQVVGALKPLFVGDPLRLQHFTLVQPDAPEQGAVVVSVPE